jgi:hypothetical protein
MLQNNVPPALGSSGSNSNNVTLSVPSSPQAQSNSLPSTLLVNSMAGSNLSSPQDFQTRMMQMMTDTLSKLVPMI